MADTMSANRPSRGPRRGNPGPRVGSRGGIQKNNTGARLKVDKDGDLDMDGENKRSGPGRGSGRGSGRGVSVTAPRASTRGGPRVRPQRNTTAVVERALTRSGDRNNVNLRVGSRGLRRNQDPKGLTKIAIRGWTQSKAASNPEGAIVSLKPWLEKKASSPGQSAVIQEVSRHSIHGSHKRLGVFGALHGLLSFHANLSNDDRGP